MLLTVPSRATNCPNFRVIPIWTADVLHRRGQTKVIEGGRLSVQQRSNDIISSVIHVQDIQRSITIFFRLISGQQSKSLLPRWDESLTDFLWNIYIFRFELLITKCHWERASEASQLGLGIIIVYWTERGRQELSGDWARPGLPDTWLSSSIATPRLLCDRKQGRLSREKIPAFLQDISIKAPRRKVLTS